MDFLVKMLKTFLLSYSAVVQFSSVAQSCPTHCDPNESQPGLPVHHQLPEFTQTHIHWVGDAIQPSHPLSPPFPFAISLSQHQGLFQRLFVSGGQSIGTSASASALLIISQGWCPLGLFWSPFHPRGSQESFSAPQFKSINSSVLSLLYGPALTPMHDHKKNHSFDYADFCSLPPKINVMP